MLFFILNWLHISYLHQVLFVQSKTYPSVSEWFLLAMLAIIFFLIPIVKMQFYVNASTTSKFMVLAYSILLLAAVGLTKYIIKNDKVEIKLSKIDMLLFVFLLYISINRYVVQSYYGFSIRYMELLLLALLYTVIRLVPVKNYPWLFLVIIFSGIIQGIYGNTQLLGLSMSNHPKFNLTGSFFNPGPFAGFLVCIWPISLGFYWKRDQILRFTLQKSTRITAGHIKFVRNLFGFIPLLGMGSIVLVLFFTRSRAAVLAFVVSSLLALLFERRMFFRNVKLFKGFRNTIVVCLVVFVFLGLFLFGYYSKKTSADGRFLIWKISKNIVLDHPFFGVGFDNFNKYYMNYQADYFHNNSNSYEELLGNDVKYAFNELVQLLVENGMISFVLVALISYYLFMTKVSNPKYIYINSIAKLTLISFAVFALFSYPMQILPIKLIFVFAMALIVSTNKMSNFRLIAQFKIKNKYLKVAALSLIVLFSYSINARLTLFSHGFKVWKEAHYSFNAKLFGMGAEEYNSVYDIFKTNGDFMEQYGRTLQLHKSCDKAIIVLEKAKNYKNSGSIENALGSCYKSTGAFEKAEKAYIRSSEMTPSLFYPRYLLAKLYDETNQKHKAVEVARLILNKKIKIPSNAINQIIKEMELLVIRN